LGTVFSRISAASDISSLPNKRRIWDKKVNKRRSQISVAARVRRLFKKFSVTKTHCKASQTQHWKFIFTKSDVLQFKMIYIWLKTPIEKCARGRMVTNGFFSLLLNFLTDWKCTFKLTLSAPITHICVINGRALCTTCDVINLNVIRYSW